MKRSLSVTLPRALRPTTLRLESSRLSFKNRLSVSSLLVGASILFMGCSSTTPTVKTGPHPPADDNETSVGTRVNELPPKARPEVVPLRRNKACFYRDGYWDYRGRNWRWVKGAWIVPPSDCFYAAPITRFERTSAGLALMYLRGTWYPKNDNATSCEKPVACADYVGETD